MDDDFMGLTVEAHDALLDAAHKLEGVVLKLESGQHMQLADRELAALVGFWATPSGWLIGARRAPKGRWRCFVRKVMRMRTCRRHLPVLHPRTRRHQTTLRSLREIAWGRSPLLTMPQDPPGTAAPAIECRAVLRRWMVLTLAARSGTQLE